MTNKMCVNCGQVYAIYAPTGSLSLVDLCPGCQACKEQANALRRIQAARKEAHNG
jgi:MinD superfamily P-loop ATPase